MSKTSVSAKWIGASMLAVMVSLTAMPAAAQTADAPAAATQENVIRSISVTGTQRLEADTVRSYIRLRTGQVWTQAAGDQALKDLYATELFADVSIRNNAGDVQIEVRENPVINRIIREGNKRIKNDKVEPEIKLAPRQIYSRSKVRADVARIVELYKRQGRFAALQQRKNPLASDQHGQERNQQQGSGGGAEADAAGNLLLQGQLRSQDHGGAFGEQQQVVGTAHFSDAADQQQQRKRHRGETIHGAAPGGGCAVIQQPSDQFTSAQGDQGSAADQVQTGAVVGSMGHVQQQPMAQRQQPDHRQGAGQQPAAHKQATAPQRRAPQQQQQQQNDVDGRQRHAKPVGQQFRPDPGFRHGPCSELAAHSRRIRAARPMLTPKLRTPSRALQKALSFVSRKLLKTCQGLYSPVVPSGSR